MSLLAATNHCSDTDVLLACALLNSPNQLPGVVQELAVGKGHMI